ncbi:alpha/beta hydrolase [Granulicella sp. S190]|uniref:alpha/beta hydrolase n=1 Tax=Granulicella sp. S190 TaxID=1747226 RepID=UPI00131ADB9B|nr:alpha/beta hydrolase [Granulicella sp. S190]
MDVLSRPAPNADHRIFYGTNPYQFGDLWIPQTKNKSLFPLIVFFHGGWWKSKYDLAYAGHLCAALKSIGIASWSVEYRRVGETGGGWPTTFEDAAAGLEFVRTLAKTYPFDLERVITMGHSAGGHLAFWVAGRHHIEPHHELAILPSHVSLLGTIALAGAVDLRLTIDLSGYFTFAHDRHEVYALMGGPPDLLPERYKAGNPGDLLPFNMPQFLIQGTKDDQIPLGLPSRWAILARGAGDEVKVEMIPSADHFDVVDPESEAWRTVSETVRSLLFNSKQARPHP